MGPLLDVLHARVTSHLRDWVEVRIQTGVGVCFAGGEEWDATESEDNPPLPPFEDAGGFVVALPGLGAWPVFRASSGS